MAKVLTEMRARLHLLLTKEMTAEIFAFIWSLIALREFPGGA